MLSVRQWLFTELRPTYHQARIIWITTCWAVLSKINVCKLMHIIEVSMVKEILTNSIFSQIVYITWRYTLLAKKRRLSSVNPRPQLALNLTSRVAATWTHGTLSGTKNGWRPHSANALSHNIVAQAWGSWFPCTITTTGKDGAHTYNKLRWRELAIYFYYH